MANTEANVWYVTHAVVRLTLLKGYDSRCCYRVEKPTVTSQVMLSNEKRREMFDFNRNQRHKVRAKFRIVLINIFKSVTLFTIQTDTLSTKYLHSLDILPRIISDCPTGSTLTWLINLPSRKSLPTLHTVKISAARFIRLCESRRRDILMIICGPVVTFNHLFYRDWLSMITLYVYIMPRAVRSMSFSYSRKNYVARAGKFIFVLGRQ